MDLKKVYHDSDGNECNIFQMVRREPEWAANILQQGEIAIAELRALKEHASQQPDSADAKCDHDWKHYPIKPGGFTKCSKCGERR